MSTSLPPGLKELLNELEEYAPAVRGYEHADTSRRRLCRQLRGVPASARLLTSLAPVRVQVPDEVTQHALRTSGYECKDPRT